jgi:hypothetical protein
MHNVLLVNIIEGALGKGKIEDGIKQVGLSASVISDKAIQFGTELTCELRIVFEMEELDIFKIH